MMYIKGDRNRSTDIRGIRCTLWAIEREWWRRVESEIMVKNDQNCIPKLNILSFKVFFYMYLYKRRGQKHARIDIY